MLEEDHSLDCSLDKSIIGQPQDFDGDPYYDHSYFGAKNVALMALGSAIGTVLNGQGRTEILHRILTKLPQNKNGHLVALDVALLNTGYFYTLINVIKQIVGDLL